MWEYADIIIVMYLLYTSKEETGHDIHSAGNI